MYIGPGVKHEIWQSPAGYVGQKTMGRKPESTIANCQLQQSLLPFASVQRLVLVYKLAILDGKCPSLNKLVIHKLELLLVRASSRK